MKETDIARLAPELAEQGECTAPDGAEADSRAVQGVRPALVFAPSTPEGLAAGLACCDRAGASAIPWGGGTQQKLGQPPRRADVVVVTRRLNRLVEHEPGDLTAAAEAGIRFDDLQALLARHDQWLPLDPPLPPEATLGGLIATNVSGPRRLREGSLRDLVIGTRVANVDGTVTRAGGRVVKNVTGYDLNKLQIGALGTLGVVVEVAFKLAPRPEVERSWFALFPTAESAALSAGSLLRLPVLPTGLELLNHRAARRVGLDVPPGQWALLGRSCGFSHVVQRHLAEFDAAARAAATATDRPGEAQARSLWSTYAKVAAELRWSAEALTCRLAVPPGALGTLCGRISGLGEGPLIWAHATGAVFWSVPTGGPSLGEAASGLRELAGEVGGALVVENRPAALADLEVWGVPGGPVAMMRALKQQYDPRGTLNPGRFVGGI